MARPDLVALVRRVDEGGGLDAVIGMVRDGKTMREIAEHFSTTRSMMYNWFKNEDRRKQGDATRQLKRARVESAEAHAENALDIVDQPAIDQTEVSRNRERARVRMWMAEKLDRNTFGGRPEGAVVLIGELHLNALRKYGAPEAQALPRGQGEDVVDAEVLSVEDVGVPNVEEFLQ
jgi:hypothetical protein